MLSTIIGDLFELFGDERGTIGQPHVAGRQLAKERASSGVKERAHTPRSPAWGNGHA